MSSYYSPTISHYPWCHAKYFFNKDLVCFDYLLGSNYVSLQNQNMFGIFLLIKWQRIIVLSGDLFVNYRPALLWWLRARFCSIPVTSTRLQYLLSYLPNLEQQVYYLFRRFLLTTQHNHLFSRTFFRCTRSSCLHGNTRLVVQSVRSPQVLCENSSMTAWCAWPRSFPYDTFNLQERMGTLITEICALGLAPVVCWYFPKPWIQYIIEFSIWGTDCSFKFCILWLLAYDFSKTFLELARTSSFFKGAALQ